MTTLCCKFRFSTLLYSDIIPQSLIYVEQGITYAFFCDRCIFYWYLEEFFDRLSQLWCVSKSAAKKYCSKNVCEVIIRLNCDYAQLTKARAGCFFTAFSFTSMPHPGFSVSTNTPFSIINGSVKNSLSHGTSSTSNSISSRLGMTAEKWPLI